MHVRCADNASLNARMEATHSTALKNHDPIQTDSKGKAQEIRAPIQTDIIGVEPLKSVTVYRHIL